MNYLFLIRLVHTLIWIILAGTTFYILYSGLFDRITIYTWLAIAVITGEGLVLLIFKWSCPLTVIARKFSDSQKDNFDIFLPSGWQGTTKRYLHQYSLPDLYSC